MRTLTESIENIHAEGLRQFLQSNINKARLLAVFVGNIDLDTAAQLTETKLKGIDNGSFTQVTLPNAGGKVSVKHSLTERELPTTYVRGYYSAPSPENIEDTIPFFVGLDVLRDRLFEEVRTKRNLTYAVSAGMAGRRDNYGMIYVSTTDPVQAVAVMLNEIRKIQNEPVPEKDLHDKIKVLTTETLMSEQSNSSQVTRLARHELIGRGFAWAEKRIELFQQVTAEEIKRVMNEYVKDINYCILGDPTSGQELLDQVEAS